MQWSDFQKNLQLFIVTLAAIVPDFDSGIGKFSERIGIVLQTQPRSTLSRHTIRYRVYLRAGPAIRHYYGCDQQLDFQVSTRSVSAETA